MHSRAPIPCAVGFHSPLLLYHVCGETLTLCRRWYWLNPNTRFYKDDFSDSDSDSESDSDSDDDGTVTAREMRLKRYWPAVPFWVQPDHPEPLLQNSPPGSRNGKRDFEFNSTSIPPRDEPENAESGEDPTMPKDDGIERRYLLDDGNVIMRTYEIKIGDGFIGMGEKDGITWVVKRLD